MNDLFKTIATYVGGGCVAASPTASPVATIAASPAGGIIATVTINTGTGNDDDDDDDDKASAESHHQKKRRTDYQNELEETKMRLMEAQKILDSIEKECDNGQCVLCPISYDAIDAGIKCPNDKCQSYYKLNSIFSWFIKTTEARIRSETVPYDIEMFKCPSCSIGYSMDRWVQNYQLTCDRIAKRVLDIIHPAPPNKRKRKMPGSTRYFNKIFDDETGITYWPAASMYTSSNFVSIVNSDDPNQSKYMYYDKVTAWVYTGPLRNGRPIGVGGKVYTQVEVRTNQHRSYEHDRIIDTVFNNDGLLIKGTVEVPAKYTYTGSFSKKFELVDGTIQSIEVPPAKPRIYTGLITNDVMELFI